MAETVTHALQTKKCDATQGRQKKLGSSDRPKKKVKETGFTESYVVGGDVHKLSPLTEAGAARQQSHLIPPPTSFRDQFPCGPF